MTNKKRPLSFRERSFLIAAQIPPPALPGSGSTVHAAFGGVSAWFCPSSRKVIMMLAKSIGALDGAVKLH